jgi:hypothetical protein
MSEFTLQSPYTSLGERCPSFFPQLNQRRSRNHRVSALRPNAGVAHDL